eukprot:gene2436-2769_t
MLRKRGKSLSFTDAAVVPILLNVRSVHILELIIASFPTAFRPESTLAIDYLALSGLLPLVEWAHSRGYGATIQAIDKCAGLGHVDVVSFLIRNRREGFSGGAIVAAAKEGYLDMLNLLVANSYVPQPSIEEGFIAACGKGHLDICNILADLHPNGMRTGCLPQAGTEAAKNGHFEIIKMLHTRGINSAFSSSAMDQAAANKHLDIVVYLGQNRTEGCTKAALNSAAKNSDADMVNYLKTRQGANIAEAKDAACAGGDYSMLYALDGDCTIVGLLDACSNGHMLVVESLLMSQPEFKSKSIMAEAFLEASKGGHYSIVSQVLILPNDLVPSLTAALSKGHLRVVEFIMQFVRTQCTAAIHIAAYKGGSRACVELVERNIKEIVKIDWVKCLASTIEGGHTDLLAYLLEKNKPINKQQALELACGQANAAMIRQLIQTDTKFTITSAMLLGIIRKRSLHSLEQLYNNNNIPAPNILVDPIYIQSLLKSPISIIQFHITYWSFTLSAAFVAANRPFLMSLPPQHLTFITSQFPALHSELGSKQIKRS